MQKIRVIQWATGKVGKLSLRAILEDSRLELAGVYAYSADKVGVDAGKLCELPDCGVLATDDFEALLSLGADTVVYTPFMADLAHVVRMLENGHDVVSTNLFANLGGVQGEVRGTLQAACIRGGSSLYITGVNPGWINTIAVAMTATCRRVDSVSISESADCSGYQSAETWRSMGMSLPAVTPEVMASARTWLQSFRDAVCRMAEALHFTLEDIEFSAEYATASQRVDLGWFCMEKDTIAAVRAGWNGIVGGRTVVQTRVNWYLTKHLNEGWQFIDEQYHLVIAGDPGIDTRIRFVPPASWTHADWEIVTALPAVNVIPNVLAAAPGVLSLGNVGLPCAPAGIWLAS